MLKCNSEYKQIYNNIKKELRECAKKLCLVILNVKEVYYV